MGRKKRAEKEDEHGHCVIFEQQWTRTYLASMSKAVRFRLVRTMEPMPIRRIEDSLFNGKDNYVTSTRQVEADCPQNLAMMSSRLPKLRTLHLRNLPKVDLTTSYLPIDYLVKGIASKILDRYADGKPSSRRKSLITIALGAVLYRDIYTGSNHFPRDPVHDYLQLRVYHVDLSYQSILGPSSTVTQVAKGFVDDVTMCFDKEVLSEYWLN